MTTVHFSRVAILLLVASSIAQSVSNPSDRNVQGTVHAQASGAEATSANQFPAGTIIQAELSKSLDAKKAKVGDKVEAKLPVDLLSHGKILIPRNTKIIGHVVAVKAHSKESPDSSLGIVFDRIVLKDGSEVVAQIVVQAIARPLVTVTSTDSEPSAGPANTPGFPMPSSGATRYPRASGSEPDQPPAQSIAPLAPTSRGVIGMKGVSLEASGQRSVVSSKTDNVHLDTSTQLILRTQ